MSLASADFRRVEPIVGCCTPEIKAEEAFYDQLPTARAVGGPAHAKYAVHELTQVAEYESAELLCGSDQCPSTLTGLQLHLVLHLEQLHLYGNREAVDFCSVP